MQSPLFAPKILNSQHLLRDLMGGDFVQRAKPTFRSAGNKAKNWRNKTPMKLSNCIFNSGCCNFDQVDFYTHFL